MNTRIRTFLSTNSGTYIVQRARKVDYYSRLWRLQRASAIKPVSESRILYFFHNHTNYFIIRLVLKRRFLFHTQAVGSEPITHGC